MQVRSVTEQEFAGLQGEWSALLNRSPQAGPMLAWEWMFSWWESYRESRVRRELHVLAARRDSGELVGLAPFVRRPWREFGVTTRRLEFIGTGEAEEDETCSEYLDLIVDPGAAEEAVGAFARHLAGDGRWDEIVCRDVRADGAAAVARLAPALAAAGAPVRVSPFGQSRSPYIALPPTWGEYLGGLSRNSRRIVRYKRRQFEERLPAADLAMAETPEAVARGFEGFVRLHGQRWSGTARGGCFGSPAFEGFMRRVTPRLAACGGVAIASLLAEGEPVAAYYLLRLGQALYYYNSGTALDRFADLSPGSVCLGYIVEEAIRRGAKEFHFFKGGAGSYKYHWTDRAVPLTGYLIRRRGWKGGVRRAAEMGVNLLRNVTRTATRPARAAKENGDPDR